MSRFVPVTVTFSAGLLLLAASAAPWLATHGHPVGAQADFAFFSKICHQRPERSLVLFGTPMAVCARCVGIYAGTAIGSLLHLARRTSLRLTIAGSLLNCIDIAAQSAIPNVDRPWLRLLCGLLLGIGTGALLNLRTESAVRADSLIC